MKPIQRKSTVFIFGAGASSAAGAPLMNTFLQVADTLLEEEKATWASECFEHVFTARRELQSAFAKSYIDIDNLESLFSSFEMAYLVEQLGSLDVKVVQQLPEALRQCILRTLELSVKFELDKSDPIVKSPYPYDAFAELVKLMHMQKGIGPVTLITFNYDLALDYALLRAGFTIDYGLSSIKDASNDVICLFKPHGSLNWTKDGNGKISAKPVRLLDSSYYWRRLGVPERDLRKIAIDTAELLNEEIEWGERLRPAPFIVPPTLGKAEHQLQVRAIWQRIVGTLSGATNILVSGYSLPPSDYFFRSFFALSMMSPTLIDKFIVFDPGDVETTWRTLCGSAIRERNRFSYERTTFAGAIPTLLRTFQLPEEGVLKLLKN